MSYDNSSPGDGLVFDVGSPAEGGGGAAAEQPVAVTAQAAEPEGYVPSYRGELDDQPAAVTSFEDIFGSVDNGYSSSLPALDTTSTKQSQPAAPVKASQDTAAKTAGENIAEDVTGTATGGMDEAFADLTPEQIDSMSEDELLAHYTGEPISLDDGIPSSLDEYETSRSGVEEQASSEEGGKKAAPVLTLDVHKILGTAGNAVDQVTKKALTLPGLSKLKPAVTVGSVFVRAATVAIILILLLFVFSAVSKLESGTGQTPVAAAVELPDSGEVKVTNIIRRDNKTYATVENSGDRTERNISVSVTGGAAHIMNPLSWFSPSKDEAKCGGGAQSLEAGQSQDVELDCDHQVTGFRVSFDAKVEADE